MNKILLAAVILSLIVSCAPSPEKIREAIEQTQTASQLLISTNVPTPTLIPLDELDLEPLLIQGNDLPSGYTASHVKEIGSDSYKWISNHGIANISQSFAHNGEDSGGVTVFLYTNTEDSKTAYLEQLESLGSETKSAVDVGDENAYVHISILGDVVELSFRRCLAVVDIKMFDNDDPDDVIAYAKRLDKRIEPIVCR